MTFTEAMDVLSPPWLKIWINILSLGAFVAPLALLIWKPTRMTGLICLAASILAAVSIMMIYNWLGYVKLLGLGHIIFWTPLAIYLWRTIKTEDLTMAPKAIMGFILVTILISLAFDYVDTARYILGDRIPRAVAPS